jgi:acyl CoA:acetate/3-ketoacid CoA transferase
LRSAASGNQGLITKVGIGTYVDPRIEGGKMNDIIKRNISEIIQLKGEEYLFYPPLSIDTALICGTYADEKGNVTLEQEAFTPGVLYLAMAAKNTGGKVIAQVKKIVEQNSIKPKQIIVPGALIDNIVLFDYDYEDERDPAINGSIREIISKEDIETSPQTVIAKCALD